MKRLHKIIPFTAFISGLIVLTSCTEFNTEQNNIEQEQRFFDIYMGANYPDVLPQASGLYYVENKEGTGNMPGDTTWVLINHVAYIIPGDKVYETYIEKVAIDNRLQDAEALYGPYKIRNGLHNEGFTEGLSLMREGGEATILFTSELGYGSMSSSDVGAYTSWKYEIVLLEVLGDDIEAYEASKIVAYTDTIAGVVPVYDSLENISMYYVVDESTDGPPVAVDSTIEVVYKGYLTDGRVFDESTEGKGLKFKVGDPGEGIIDGWHLGLENFKEGEKGRLIIPYQLAYGEYGRYTDMNNVAIPPYETLVFDVEVVSVEAGDGLDKPDPEE